MTSSILDVSYNFWIFLRISNSPYFSNKQTNAIHAMPNQKSQKETNRQLKYLKVVNLNKNPPIQSPFQTYDKQNHN